MPKDITHWVIASEVQKRLNDGRLSSIICKNFAAYAIGAIAYDIPYYGLGKYARILEEKADELHGTKSCDVWTPIVRMLRNARLDDNIDCREAALALALGSITHVIIDSRFHPYIYYFTGDYHDSDPDKRNQAIFKHRELETQLDLFSLEKRGYDGPKRAKEFVAQLPRQALIKNLSLLYFGGDGIEQVNTTQHCLDSYIKYQAFFDNGALKYLLSLIGLVNIEIKKISALFYPKSVQPAYYELFLTGEQYRHPSSGEVVKTSLDRIFNECITIILAIFSQLGFCTTVDEYLKIIDGFPPVSLTTGKECTEPSLMRFFPNNPSTADSGETEIVELALKKAGGSSGSLLCQQPYSWVK